MTLYCCTSFSRLETMAGLSAATFCCSHGSALMLNRHDSDQLLDRQKKVGVSGDALQFTWGQRSGHGDMGTEMGPVIESRRLLSRGAIYLGTEGWS